MAGDALIRKQDKRVAERVFPILLVSFVGSLSFSIVLPFLVIIVFKLGGNEVVYGVLGATYSLFQFFGAPILGSWSDRLGRKRILLLSSIGTLLGWIIFIIALSLPDTKFSIVLAGGTFFISIPLVFIFLARAIDGITGANVSVANAYLADISKKKDRKRNFGRISAASNLGLILGPSIAGVLGHTIYGDLLPLIAAALFSLVSMILISTRLKDVAPTKITTVLQRSKTGSLIGMDQNECYLITNEKKNIPVFKLPNVPYFIMLYFLIFLAFNFFYVAFPVFTAQKLHWTLLQIGVFFSVLSALLVLIEGPVLTWLSNKISSSFLVIVGSLILSLAFIFFRSEQAAFIYMGALLFAIGNGFMWPSFLAIMSNIVEDQYQGVIQGYATSAGSLAGIIGLLSGALLYKLFEVNVFLITTGIMVVIAFLSYRLIRIEKDTGTLRF
jgi:DHA1 family tetracycline resistance protein-like MFS transporter